MKKPLLIILGLMFLFFSACRDGDIIDDLTNQDKDSTDLTSYPDWTEETHGNSAGLNYDVVFNQNKVLRLDIEIDSEIWSEMQSNLASILGSPLSEGPGSFGPPPHAMKGLGPGGGGPGGGGPGVEESMEDPDWFPCSLVFEGTEWYNVGIRYKGNSSLRSAYQSGIKKLSLKLDFDEFEDDYPGLENQRFYGFKQLNLNNNYDDASFMREKVGADLFREFGLIASQTAFCAVYIDNGTGSQYFGLYALVEEVDDSVLETQVGDDSGNLYKPEGSAATFAKGTFDEDEMYKKTNEDLGDYSDVKALYDIINDSKRTTATEAWKEELELVFNVDVFMKWLAANTVIQNWDTYGVMNHNYYLYNKPSEGKLNWIPWDNNEAFQAGKQGGALSLSLSEVGNDWPLISYLIAVDEYQDLYKTYLRRFIEEVFVPADMISTYSAYYELIKEYADAEESGYTFLRYSSQFDSAVESLKSHVQARNNAVNSFLD